MNATAEKQEVVQPDNALAPYDEFRSQLATLKAENAKTIFEYDTPKGNAAARSYCRKLASTAVAIDTRRKELGADARAYIDRVNKEGQALEAEDRAMIEPHKKAISEIEEKEKARVAEIRSRIDGIKAYANCAGEVSQALRDNIATIEAMSIDVTFAEFMAEATTARENTLSALRDELAQAEKREAEAAELERLRKEAEERAERDRLEAIRKEAEERARKEAEEAAERERARAAKEKEDAERRERELKEQAEKAERDRLESEKRAEKEKAEAIVRAEKEKQEAVEAERRRQEQEATAKAAEEAKREADHKHQAKIHHEIVAAFESLGQGISLEQSKAIISAIRAGSVPHVKITY